MEKRLHFYPGEKSVCERVIGLLELTDLFYEESDPQIRDGVEALIRMGQIKMPKDGHRLELTPEAKQYMREHRAECRKLTRHIHM